MRPESPCSKLTNREPELGWASRLRARQVTLQASLGFGWWGNGISWAAGLWKFWAEKQGSWGRGSWPGQRLEEAAERPRPRQTGGVNGSDRVRPDLCPAA